MIFCRDPEYSLKKQAGTVGKTTQKTTQKQTDILAYLSKNPKAGRDEIAQNIEVITESGVKYNLKALQKKGLLKRVGSAKGGHWEVIENKQ